MGIYEVKSPIEVEQIWSRDGNVEIVASFHEEKLSRPSVVLVQRERPDITVSRRAQLREPGFCVTYSAEVLALSCPDGKACWDAYLEADSVNGPVRLRMGRHRDDVRDKRKIMVYPGQVVPGWAGDVLVKPRYTIENNVSIDCVPRDIP
jgi:hypothetical protein